MISVCKMHVLTVLNIVYVIRYFLKRESKLFTGLFRFGSFLERRQQSEILLATCELGESFIYTCIDPWHLLLLTIMIGNTILYSFNYVVN